MEAEPVQPRPEDTTDRNSIGQAVNGRGGIHKLRDKNRNCDGRG